MATTISGVRTRDLRFRLAPGEGTDAVHSSGMYGYGYCVLETTTGGSAEGELEGHVSADGRCICA
jgi:hypothetical protein